MNKTDGGPEFSALGHAMSNYGGCIDWSGMTLRDWFAGQALAGSLAVGDPAWTVRTPHSPENFAAWAYRVADAMLAERAKVGGEE